MADKNKEIIDITKFKDLEKYAEEAVNNGGTFNAVFTTKSGNPPTCRIEAKPSRTGGVDYFLDGKEIDKGVLEKYFNNNINESKSAGQVAVGVASKTVKTTAKAANTAMRTVNTVDGVARKLASMADAMAR